MDVVSALTTQIDAVVDAIYKAITDIANKYNVTIYYGNNPPIDGNDYPSELLYVIVKEKPVARYAMCNRSFNIPFTVYAEMQSRITNETQHRNLVREINLLFTQGTIGYTLYMLSQSSNEKTLSDGVRVTYTANIELHTNI